MLYNAVKGYLMNSAEEYDLLARITQHPGRPRPNRDVDQIFMLPGSQLNQAKLISPYLKDRRVAFVGDGDCMALVIGILSSRRVIDGPESMLVLDFDERLVAFVNEAAHEFGFHDQIEAIHYNVFDPVPASLRHSFEVFYTNPPYGSKNQGASGIGFLARCLALCSPINSSGIAILPYSNGLGWSRMAMFKIQRFMSDNGYTVGDMLRGMHSYHLDDMPQLRSATVVFDRVEAVQTPFSDERLPPEITDYFYGSKNLEIPLRIGTDGNIVPRTEDVPSPGAST